MTDTYWDHPSRRETKRLIDLGDAGAILDELQNGATEWGDAREALDHLLRGAATARAEVERLSAEADRLEADRDRLKGERDHRESLWRDEHFLRKAAELRADQAEAERDNARADAKRLNVLARDLNSLVEELRADGKRLFHEREDARHDRSALSEQVRRVRELAAYFRDREADLKERYDKEEDDARSTALLSSAALTGDAAHRIERALDGTEDGQ